MLPKNSRRLLLATIMIIFLSSPCIAEGEISLSDTIRQAVAHHPNIEAGKSARDAAKKSLSEQNAAFFPTLSLQGRAGHMDSNDDTTRSVTGGSASSWLREGTVTFTQPLFAGFGVVNRVDAAKFRVEAAEQTLGGETEDVALTAARAHLNLMRTRELLDLSNRHLTEIQKRKDNIDLMVREKAADSSEELQADEILIAAKTARLGFDEAYRQAEADYIEAAGAAPAGALKTGDASWDGLIPASVDEALKVAKASNPRVIAANNLVSAIGKEASAEKSSLMPKVDAEMSYVDKDQTDDVGGEMDSAQAMVKMSWNFNLGGGQFARMARGQEQQAEARARSQGAIRTTEHMVRQKFTSMDIVDQQYSLFEARQKAGENILQTYLSQFEGGKQSNLQIIAAQARLFDTQTARTDAYYRRLLARFELLNAMGRLRTLASAAPAATAASK